MRIMKTCEICGSKYYTGNGKAKYCSDACKKAGRKRTAREWRESHPDYHREYKRAHPEAYEKFKERHPDYDRDRSREIRESKEYAKRCVVCGKEFTTWRPHKKTCSEECKLKNKKERAKISLRGKYYKRSPEQEHAYWIKRRYGSEEAWQEHLTEKQRQTEQTRLQREAEKEARLIHGECAVCGSPFTTFNPMQRTCGGKCSKKLQYARKQNRIPKDQVMDKDITLEALYRRDSGVCYLCGGQCDWSDRDGTITGGSYPSIDHIIPISRGGFHSWDNVRLAHFECNAKKSDMLLPNAKEMIPQNAYSLKREPIERKKKTIQMTLDGFFIAEYESTAEAERVTGIKQRGIQNCARGETKTYGGYIWDYA